jgi:uncharacterized protein YlxW (UPF0749 family)
MVTTKKDAIDLQNQIDKLSKDFDAGPFAHDLQHHPGKKGPNDLEQRIEDLMTINKSHQKLNGDLRAEVMFYKKKAEHYEIMSKQLKEDNKKLAQQINDQIERIRKGL